MKVTVLRLGHRKSRDKRITTHCALVARAFGAEKIVLSGEEDASVLKSVRGVVENWGGPFKISFEKNWRKTLKKFKGFKIHLTMYGERPDYAKLRGHDKMLVVIGAEKVPGEVYKAVDANIAIGSQPHSEVGALAVFLSGLLGEKELWKRRKGAKLEIIPQKNSKKVVSARWKKVFAPRAGAQRY